MTIAEAAREVLRRAERSMTVDEIYDQIVATGLAEFKAAHPRSVLRNQIRRHCDGVPHASPTRTKLFVQAADGRYSLID